MAAQAPARKAGSPPTAGISSVSLWSRFYGFGSIYAKTMRDSRLTVLIVTGLLGGIMLSGAYAIASAYPTPASRADLSSFVDSMPASFRGLTSNPVNLGTLGGYLSWKYGPFFALIAGLWSIVALSGTLASESGRGSMDMVAAAPFGKRRIAIEKLAAHITGMVIACTFMGVVTYAGTHAFAKITGDALPVEAAVGIAVWVGLIGLVSGSVAWALAPFTGRASAAGVAGAFLIGGFAISGYSTSVPALEIPAAFSWFKWTAGHLPLAAQYDWLSLVPVAVITVVLFAVGIVAFDRRDLGSTSAIPTPSLPGALLGVRGPIGRSFGERLTGALAWGFGLAIYAALIAASSRSFSDSLKASPDTNKLFETLFKGYDIASAGGFLQLMFAYMGYLIAGLAAAVFVSGWASDEKDRRLEMLLASPLGRARWAISGGIGVFMAIAVMTAVAMAGIALGVAAAGGDILTPVAGAMIIGLYAAAAAGIGMAVGGLFRNSIAGEVTALFVIATFIIDFMAPPLNLPDWFHQLALSSHMGRTMVGQWDVAGVGVCLAVAVIGLILGGYGMQRRDLV
ncbi:MAG TPA: ABC transporter permease subunit [Candidatus Limnocylindrales bacterium]